ncbi:MAG: ABC transporter permease subunit [Fastidiosipilaceae bacterium]|jgi:peptide/nickel transport system permease protein|nr:ABC transporter permease subunit [Clostridiaceae bacterium]
MNKKTRQLQCRQKGRSLTKVLIVLVVLIVCFALFGPFFVPLVGDPHKTEAFPFDGGGPLNMGYDYLGRPVAAQLLIGGRELLIAAFLTAVLSQVTGMTCGLIMAVLRKRTKILRFLLDMMLIIPMSLSTLVIYNHAGSSLYATIPIATFFTLPFTSRYYAGNAEPLLRTGFYEQAMVAGDSVPLALIREIIPVLFRPILTDLGMSMISAVYLMSTVSFLGIANNNNSFLWPTMVMQNLSGLALNPYATLMPIFAIVWLTIPLNILIDQFSNRRRK